MALSSTHFNMENWSNQSPRKDKSRDLFEYSDVTKCFTPDYDSFFTQPLKLETRDAMVFHFPESLVNLDESSDYSECVTPSPSKTTSTCSSPDGLVPNPAYLLPANATELDRADLPPLVSVEECKNLLCPPRKGGPQSSLSGSFTVSNMFPGIDGLDGGLTYTDEIFQDAIALFGSDAAGDEAPNLVRRQYEPFPIDQACAELSLKKEEKVEEYTKELLLLKPEEELLDTKRFCREQLNIIYEEELRGMEEAGSPASVETASPCKTKLEHNGGFRDGYQLPPPSEQHMETEYYRNTRLDSPPAYENHSPVASPHQTTTTPCKIKNSYSLAPRAPPPYHEAIQHLAGSTPSASPLSTPEKCNFSPKSPSTILNDLFHPKMLVDVKPSAHRQLTYDYNHNADLESFLEVPYPNPQAGLYHDVQGKMTKTKKKSRSFYEVNPSTRPFICEWTNCGKTFKERKHLVVHMRIHNDERPLVCSYCDYQCRQRTSLNWHVKKKHPDLFVEYERCRQKCKGRPKTMCNTVLPTVYGQTSAT